MSAVLSRCSLVALGVFAATVAHGGEQAKPAKHYELTPIVATNDAQCEPGFAQRTFTRRINASGQVIGYQVCWEPSGIPETPFFINFGWGYLFTPGVASRLLPNVAAGDFGTLGRALNDAGVAVGWEATETSLSAPLWLPSGGASYAVEPDPCSSFTIAQADDINNHGSIAAGATRATATGCRGSWILKRADGSEAVGPLLGHPDAMNEHDVMAGQQGNTAVKWSPTLGVVALAPEGIPGVERLRAFNINDREQIVGEWQHFELNDQCLKGADAVFWDSNGAAQKLERLRHDTDAIALGINDQGLIVGNSRSHSGCNTFDPDLQRAVIWHKGKVTDLNKLLEKSDAREIQLIQASDINERGQIAAFGFYKNRPLDKCWDFVFNPDTGEGVYDTTLRCRSIHAFLMTPKDE
jgi:hypothetical protein